VHLHPYFLKGQVEAGLDEAGRGCLAGPVTAAGVILPQDFNHPLLNDSKKLTEKQRVALRPIIEKEAIAFSVVHLPPKTIDRINILQASILAMHYCVDSLSIRPELLLVDGNRFNPYLGITHHCVVGGDAKFASIAAASILAKTARDNYMRVLDQRHPEYLWSQNKGYPTEAHVAAIKNKGITQHHRKSFALGS
jgi:ribonuclease HII